MKNTALLIDTNVILNYLTGRSDQYLDSSIKIVKKCASGECTGYIAFHTLSTLWYVLRKWSDKERRDSLKLVCQIFTVASASQSEILAAIENDKFSDFEDCLQDECAQEFDADFIVTRNVKDFAHSTVKAVSPEEFIQLAG